MTRVLMSADCVGGVFTYAVELADALAAYDVEVHVAFMGRELSASQRAQLSTSSVAAVYESSYALEWMADPWRDVDAAGEWLLALADKVRAQVVHLNSYAHATLPWRVPVVVVAHSDVVSWWRAVHRAAPPASWDVYRERVAVGLRAASAVVAPTRAVLRDIAASFGYHGGVAIPNCRRDDWVRRDVAREQLVVGAGRLWDEAKNLAALERVADRVPWPVQVLSNLPFADVATQLARASVFAEPARYEPFGLAALEAAVSGCALVVGDIPSLREVWDDAAIYVDPFDDDAFAAALTQLCGDPALLQSYAVRARERAATYTPARTAAAYHDLYRQLSTQAGAA